MFKKMTVGTKLISGFLTLAIIGAIVACIGIYDMGRIDDKANDMYNQELMGLSYIKEANINLIYIGREQGNVLLARTKDEREKNTANMKKYLADANDYLEKAKPLFYAQESKALFTQYENASKLYEQELWRATKLIDDEKLAEHSDELSIALREARRHTDTLDDLLSSLAEQKEISAKQMSEHTTELYEHSRMVMILLVVGSALFGIGLGVLITRGLTRQLGGEPGYAADVAERIAAGDLTVPIELKANDKTSLLFAMRTMRDSLIHIVSQVRTGTDTIATASSQIAAGNLDLSSRTEEQASALEETASSMEEITSVVKQNADNSNEANKLAASASDIAIKGGEVVSQVVNTMDSITESSRKIVDIISVIDGIAFQTNILALNAAVEAARAGEQGRGFAVVATEVRNLAQRSASAAKEIKQLIGDSVEKVDNGSQLVSQAGETMGEVVASVKRVTDIIAEITAASREQSAGIEQVNQAITQMDEVTQQNAALVEQAAAASQSLQSQASNLSEVVSVFKLNGMQTSIVKTAALVTSVPRAIVKSVAKPTVKLATSKPRLAAPVGGDQEWEEF
jgi:methyl-accepting chemotaxis protein